MKESSNGKHLRIQGNVLLVVFGTGAMAAPIVGAVRESLQAEMGISRGQLGLWVFLIGIVGAGAALVLSMLLRGMVRTSFVRAGILGMFVGCGLLALGSSNGAWGLLLLGIGWFAIRLGHPLTGSANGIFADLWESSPHTGLIILHAVNSAGKVAAPLAVVLLGSDVRPASLVFTVMFGALLLESLLWPKDSLRELCEIERGRETEPQVRVPRDPLVWICVLQFAFIAGAEGGATSIMGSLVQELRPVPVEWISAETWPSVVLMLLTLGIFIGRTVFAVLSLRLSERAILVVCLFCGLFCVPAAFVANPAIYLPSTFLTGVCFSATWPAFFSLAARTYPVKRTFLGIAALFFSTLGIWSGTFLTSAIGNAQRYLPHAFVAGTALMIPFVVFLVSASGRGLAREEPGASA